MKELRCMTVNDLPKMVNYWQNVLAIQEAKNRYSYIRSEHKTHIQKYGFPIITSEAVTLLVDWIANRSVFEIGAGNGYLARVLSDAGINITAIDNRSTSFSDINWWTECLWYDVKNESLEQYKEIPGEIVLMCWPDNTNESSYNAVVKMSPNQILIFMGEYQGATGSEEFFSYIEDNFELVSDITEKLQDTSCSFKGWHDTWYVFRKIK